MWNPFSAGFHLGRFFCLLTDSHRRRRREFWLHCWSLNHWLMHQLVLTAGRNPLTSATFGNAFGNTAAVGLVQRLGSDHRGTTQAKSDHHGTCCLGRFWCTPDEMSRDRQQEQVFNRLSMGCLMDVAMVFIHPSETQHYPDSNNCAMWLRSILVTAWSVALQCLFCILLHEFAILSFLFCVLSFNSFLSCWI